MQWLYHVTYYGRLDSIARKGLTPDSEGAIGRHGVYAHHSRGKVFFTVGGGVPFWFGRLEEHAQYNSENVYEDQLVPVVLRVQLDVAKLEPDEIGTRDARRDAYVARHPIDPERLEVFTGDDWHPLIDTIDEGWMEPIERGVNVTEEQDDEDSEPYTLAQFKPWTTTAEAFDESPDYYTPFMPAEEHLRS